MATFVSLINWTEQGIQKFSDSIKRAEAFEQLVERHGGKVQEIVWTIGPYDIVAIVEAPDDETYTAMALGVAALGNVRTTSLRGFSKDEFSSIISKTG
jgi:uncharacterized protein with GYD domain